MRIVSSFRVDFVKVIMCRLMGLSQFPDQAKILFPPLSMFQAIKAAGGAAGEFWFGDKTEAVEMQNGSKQGRGPFQGGSVRRSTSCPLYLTRDGSSGSILRGRATKLPRSTPAPSCSSNKHTLGLKLRCGFDSSVHFWRVFKFRPLFLGNGFII